MISIRCLRLVEFHPLVLADGFFFNSHTRDMDDWKHQQAQMAQVIAVVVVVAVVALIAVAALRFAETKNSRRPAIMTRLTA